MKKNMPQADESAKVTEDAPIIKELEPVKETKITLNIPLIIIGLSIVLAGAFTGFVLAQGKFGKTGGVGGRITGIDGAKQTVGIKCETQLQEIPEGILKEGGIDGEGTHHLERDGGPARSVYLTSSVIALDDYIDKKVKVCGETFAAEQAGWLMDVVSLEVVN